MSAAHESYIVNSCLNSCVTAAWGLKVVRQYVIVTWWLLECSAFAAHVLNRVNGDTITWDRLHRGTSGHSWQIDCCMLQLFCQACIIRACNKCMNVVVRVLVCVVYRALYLIDAGWCVTYTTTRVIRVDYNHDDLTSCRIFAWVLMQWCTSYTHQLVVDYRNVMWNACTVQA